MCAWSSSALIDLGSSSVDVVNSLRYISETFFALYQGLRQKKFLKREYAERSNALNL